MVFVTTPGTHRASRPSRTRTNNVSQTTDEGIQTITAYMQALEDEKLALLNAATPTRSENALLGSVLMLFLLLVIVAYWP